MSLRLIRYYMKKRQIKGNYREEKALVLVTAIMTATTLLAGCAGKKMMIKMLARKENKN